MTARQVAVGHPHSQPAGALGTAWPFATVSVTGGTVFQDEQRRVPFVFPYKLGPDAVFHFFAPAGTYTVTYTNPKDGSTAVETITVV